MQRPGHGAPRAAPQIATTTPTVPADSARAGERRPRYLSVIVNVDTVTVYDGLPPGGKVRPYVRPQGRSRHARAPSSSRATPGRDRRHVVRGHGARTAERHPGWLAATDVTTQQTHPLGEHLPRRTSARPAGPWGAGALVPDRSGHRETLRRRRATTTSRPRCARRIPNGLYGVLAIGISAFSETLTNWPRQAQVGIHGTNEPEKIGTDVSHGCIRMRNEDILQLTNDVPLGTPVNVSWVDRARGAPDRHRVRPTVAFRTLGCKLNQCETAQMEQALGEHGYRVVGWDGPATVRVLNTCTVTAKADAECRREIRRMKRADPGCRVAVTGCYAQVAPDKVASLDEVDLVLGNLDKFALPGHLDDSAAPRPTPSAAPRPGATTGAGTEAHAASMATPRPSRRRRDAWPTETFEGEFITHFSGYSRAFLKVQNGCDAGCSYCVIPDARGSSRSMRLADTLDAGAPVGPRRVPRSGPHRHPPGHVGSRHRRGRLGRPAGGGRRRWTRSNGSGSAPPSPWRSTTGCSRRWSPGDAGSPTTFTSRCRADRTRCCGA